MDIAIIERKNISDEIVKIQEDYVLILDSAAKVEDAVLHRLKKYNTNADILIFDYANIYPDGFLEKKTANTYHMSSKQMIKSFLSGQYSAYLGNKIFRKSLFGKMCENTDTGKYLDLSVCIELFSQDCNVAYVPEILSAKILETDRIPGGRSVIEEKETDEIVSYDKNYKRFLPILSGENRNFTYDIVARKKNLWVAKGLIKWWEYNKYAPIPLWSLLKQPWSKYGKLRYALSYLMNR